MQKNTLHQYNFDMIIENMVDGLFIVDTNRVITFLNKAAEDILGYRREEVIGKKCDFLNSSTCMGAKLANENGKCDLFSKGKIVRKRCVVTTKNGNSMYLIKNARLLKNKQGNVIGGIENIVDITEQVANERELNLLRQEFKGKCSFYKIIGNHYTMQNIYTLLEMAKDSNASVLIVGESGTGKELIAQTIHHSSYRKDNPFIKVDCAALSKTFLESELFGQVKGVIPDAVRDRKGKFETAKGGTIFLDEIGDISISIQKKILQVIQDKTIIHAGGNKPITVDTRIIASTHKDIQMLVYEEKIREDFFYRLNVIPISVPPLRERKTDIPLLTEHFIKTLNRETGKQIISCDQNTLDILMKYNWPGNVRELENAMEYAFVTCRTDTIRSHNIPEQIKKISQLNAGTLKRVGSEIEAKAQIIQALKATKGNKTKTAQLLGYSRVTLWKKIKKFGLE